MTLVEQWQLASAVRLRPEVFGGMAFHRETGITLEVDEEAYHFLCTYLIPRPLPLANLVSDHAARLVPQLVRLGFLRPAEGVVKQETSPPDVPWLSDGVTLSAPETVHLAITARCNQACSGCYVPRQGIGPELTIAELCDLVDQWAQMRVFQIAVGGGEPLLYEDLFEVLAYAREQGIVPNLTTNGTLLTADLVRRLQGAGVARVNVSWNGPGGERQERVVMRALQLLLNSTLQVGVNLLVTPALLPRLPQVLAQLQTIGVRRMTILRPKPPVTLSETSTTWYEANCLRRADLLRLREVLCSWQGALELEVDSALVGLMGDQNPVLLRRQAVYGCAAGRRICTVWPDGRMTPCSFLGDLSTGNIRQTPFAELWTRGRNWEALRDPAARPQGGCTGCAIARECGGARCVAHYEHNNGSPKSPSARPFQDTFFADLFAGDAECPHSRERYEQET